MGRKANDFAANKKSFDSVMQGYREAVSKGSLRAVNYEKTGRGGTPPDKARPTLLDLKIDIDKCINAVLFREGYNRTAFVKFLTAYVLFDTENSVEREMHAQRVLGDHRHSIEQRLGQLFREKRIYPVTGTHGYFRCIKRRLFEETRRPAPIYQPTPQVQAAMANMKVLREKLASQKPNGKGKKKVAPEIKFEVESTNRFFTGLETNRFEDSNVDVAVDVDVDAALSHQAKSYEQALAFEEAAV